MSLSMFKKIYKLLHLLLLFSLTCLQLSVSAQTKDTINKEKLMSMTLNDLMEVKVVTASKHEQSIHEAPSSVTVITAEDIERYGYETLAEVLNSIRGFYITYDRNYAYAGVRGSGVPSDYNDRFLILIDGHVINEPFYGSSWIGTDLGLNLDEVSRIEVVSGPGSVLYGTGAMFAVINIITKTGSEINGLKLKNEVGSYGKMQENAYWGKEFKNGMNLAISGIYGDVHGPRICISPILII